MFKASWLIETNIFYWQVCWFISTIFMYWSMLIVSQSCGSVIFTPLLLFLFILTVQIFPWIICIIPLYLLESYKYCRLIINVFIPKHFLFNDLNTSYYQLMLVVDLYIDELNRAVLVWLANCICWIYLLKPSNLGEK